MSASKTVWVFLGDEAHGEGIIAIANGQTLMPMVCLYEDTLSMMRDNAQMVANKTGKKVKLVKFTAREDIEEFTINAKN